MALRRRKALAKFNKKSIILFALAQIRLKPIGKFISINLAKAASLSAICPLAKASGN